METGGAQRVLLEQAEWFYRHGWRVIAAFLYDKEGLEARWQAQLPIPLVNLRARHPKASKLANLVCLFLGMFRLYQLIKKEKVSVIETFTHHSNLVGLPLAWLAGVPRRIASHHGHILGFPIWLQWAHARLINSRLTDRMVAVSRKVRLQAIKEGIRPEQIVVIANGVSLLEAEPETCRRLRLEMGVPQEGHLVLAVGRMTYQKAQTFLLKAASQILPAFPDTVFALVGDGPLRAELESEARQLGIEQQVRFPGIRQDVRQLMAAADIFVLPSRWEGLPMVLLEAMSMGTAVVATDVEGVDELIVDGQSGLLVPPENADALAKALMRLLADNAERQRMAAAGQRRVHQEYTVESMCQAYAALFANAIPPEMAGRIS